MGHCHILLVLEFKYYNQLTAILYFIQKCYDKFAHEFTHWRIQGGASGAPPPNETQFFCFCIHFDQKALTSEIGAPQRVGAQPPTGNPGSATEFYGSYNAHKMR